MWYNEKNIIGFGVEWNGKRWSSEMVITKMKEEVLRSPQLSNVWERFGGVVVIGGANIDLRGRSKEGLRRYKDFGGDREGRS